MSASSGMGDLQVSHEPVDDLGGRSEGRLGQLRVEHGGLGSGVAQDLLDDAEIHALFQQMGSVGMAQRMDRGPLVHTGLGQGLLEGDLDAGDRQGLLGGWLPPPAATGSREEPLRMAMGLPELSQKFKSPPGQRDVAILVPLAADVQEQAVAVDIGNLQGPAFGQAQPAGVDRGQADPMAEHVDARQSSTDLLETQDGGQGRDPLGLEQTDVWSSLSSGSARRRT